MAIAAVHSTFVATTPWLSDSELAAWRSLELMQLQLASELNRRLAPFDLSLQDYFVLAFLADHDGRSRVTELCRFLGFEKSRGSHHITRLVARGLVVKEQCGDDRRVWWVSITPTGRKLAAAAAPSHVADVRELFIDHATPAQLSAITKLATRVSDYLADQ